jgi:hypothetical protein
MQGPGYVQHTVGHSRTRGREADAFVESLGMVVDNTGVFDHEFGIAVLDDLERNQKIAILHLAARSLLSGDQPPPGLTAVLEGAVPHRLSAEAALGQHEERDDIARG